ncbi:predicted protein [Histoplasma capsulatum var. duboisii H88]|uniref:Predicted protein n=1 Tax=Ajellomyces capsulatus (strain H88) TaxID=544711 RepID=F0UAY9_AJEC8|nr:predicted protein [Histoplasma capsulatum var. duboisii H88]
MGKLGATFPHPTHPMKLLSFSLEGMCSEKQTVRRKSIRYLNSSARMSEGCVRYESVDKKTSHIHVEWAGLLASSAGYQFDGHIRGIVMPRKPEPMITVLQAWLELKSGFVHRSGANSLSNFSSLRLIWLVIWTFPNEIKFQNEAIRRRCFCSIVSVSVFFLPSVKLSHILGWGFCSSTSGQDLELELALFQLQDIDAIARSERERIPEPLESQRIWETLNQLSKATYHIYGWRTSPRAHLRSTLSQGPDKTESIDMKGNENGPKAVQRFGQILPGIGAP